jgi:hypothetical protein
MEDDSWIGRGIRTPRMFQGRLFKGFPCPAIAPKRRRRETIAPRWVIPVTKDLLRKRTRRPGDWRNDMASSALLAETGIGSGRGLRDHIRDLVTRSAARTEFL